MRLLVTGATGFIGARIVAQLAQAGHEVRALHRSPATGAMAMVMDRAAPAPAKLAWMRGDLGDPSSLARAAKDCEVVIHAAADLRVLGSPAALATQREVNVAGTRNVVDAAVKVGARRLVHTSSIAALGRPRAGVPGDETLRYDWPPGFHYNETKRDGEAAALAGAARGIEVIVLSPALVLGGRPPSQRGLGLLQAIRSGFLRLAPAGGTTVGHVDAVAAAHVAALELGRSGERYILGGACVSYEQLIASFAGALSAPPPLGVVPAALIEALLYPLVALGRVMPLPFPVELLTKYAAPRYYSSQKAVDELHYAPSSIEAIAADTVAAFRARGEI